MCVSFVPRQRHMWFPVRQHPGHRVSHRYLRSHVEIGVMGKLEGQQVSGVIDQDLLPCVTRLGVISTRNKIKMSTSSEGKQTD